MMEEGTVTNLPPRAFLEKNIKTLQHSATVARAARLLAERLPGLSPDEAFEAGLFHDMGKLTLPPEKIYQHPRVGFEIFQKVARPRLAAVCLTHPFPLADSVELLEAFCHHDTQEVEALQRLMKALPPSADDLLIPLIQLCDKLSGLDRYVSLDAKFAWYAQTVPASPAFLRQQKALQKIKERFDHLLQDDVYKILSITEGE